ncbi:MAG: Crp/Fnr family transcriptional regulator [Chitinophagales bacterium]|nr:Crp/Fnr family transcriptional regulator [Chitinophagales bacterium]
MKFEQPDCQHCTHRKDSLFHFCHLNELEEVNDTKSCSVYKKGQALFHEGSNPQGLFCINSGKVKIYRHASDGKEQIVRLAKPGDFVGYCSLLAGKTYPVSAEALEDAIVCMVPRSSISHLLKDNNHFTEGMVKLLCKTVEGSVSKMTDLAYKPVRGRMAEALLFLHSFYKDEQNPKGIITITREDLASFVGTVKETVIRKLNEFRKEGFIETHRSDIEVKNVNGLIQTSRLYD